MESGFKCGSGEPGSSFCVMMDILYHVPHLCGGFFAIFNELNSKSTYLRGIPTITLELLSPGQTLIDYVTNNYSSKSSVYFFGISSALTSEQKSPFPESGGFAILFNSSTTGYSSMYAFGYLPKIKGIRALDGTWDSDWADL